MTCHWHSLGVQLGVPDYKLDRIDEDHQSSDRKFHAVLRYWLENEDSPSWDTICKALQRIGGFGRLIQQITIQYCPLREIQRIRTCHLQQGIILFLLMFVTVVHNLQLASAQGFQFSVARNIQ